MTIQHSAKNNDKDKIILTIFDTNILFTNLISDIITSYSSLMGENEAAQDSNPDSILESGDISDITDF